MIVCFKKNILYIKKVYSLYFSHEIIMNCECNSFITPFYDITYVIQYLEEFDLLDPGICCEDIRKMEKSSAFADNFCYRCVKCRKRISIRKDTVFQNMKLKFVHFFSILFFWLNGMNYSMLKLLTGISKSTYARQRAVLRKVTEKAAKDVKIGGIGKIIEIDESYFFKRKYNKGKYKRTGTWVVGGVERGTGKVFLEIVPNRTSKTLERVILKHVEIGSNIYTDEWRGYKFIKLKYNSKFKHKTINHSENYVCKIDKTIHTNTIEGLWSHLKKKLRNLNGSHRKLIGGFFSEFIYKKLYNSGIESFMKQLAKYQDDIIDRKPKKISKEEEYLVDFHI